MKLILKIAFFAAAFALISGCSAQKRAERRVHRAVELCPELVQVKAHAVDTTLYAPGFADMATIPLREVVQVGTVYEATPHGTVVVSLSQSDSSLRVGFVASPVEVHYIDTLHYAQVVVEPAETKRNPLAVNLGWIVLGACAGIGICLYLFSKSN